MIYTVSWFDNDTGILRERTTRRIFDSYGESFWQDGDFYQGDDYMLYSIEENEEPMPFRSALEDAPVTENPANLPEPTPEPVTQAWDIETIGGGFSRGEIGFAGQFSAAVMEDAAMRIEMPVAEPFTHSVAVNMPPSAAPVTGAGAHAHSITAINNGWMNDRNAFGRPITPEAWEDEMYSLYTAARNQNHMETAERILSNLYHSNRRPF